MSYFDFNLNTFLDNGSLSSSFLSQSKNFTPSGESKPIVTSESKGEPKKSLTTWNVADILQGGVTMKPEALTYTQFNEQISDTSKLAYSVRINGQTIDFPGKKYLTTFDVGKITDKTLDFSINGGSFHTGTQASATTAAGKPVPPSSGFILSGNYRFPEHKTHYQDPSSGTTAIDIGHSDGAPVFSPWDGKVAYIGYVDENDKKDGASHDKDGGNAIIIVGDNGWSIYMCHFKSQPIVNIGDRVTKGQNVAFVGETGRAYGTHVHASVAQSTNWSDVFKNPISDIWDFMKSLESQASGPGVTDTQKKD